MLKKQYRLRKNSQFQHILNSGMKISTSNYNFHYINDDQFLIGVTVSKKITGAVGRNKIRRQVHSFLKSYIQEKGFLKINAVIVVKRNYLLCDYQTNKKLLFNIFSKMEVKDEK